ncbi:DUF6580 family putative transport protein [Lysobacter sp. H23M47]|uniref:DUF6580 family putative transport protein n=1 Tax=Lysobacter sp. H23M47 TaxID=2781024 RepID=UPI00188186D4|nr:DUF6580 family putative transport protein [Lysobacter sp. H23M47]QOW24079.1 hypothetical protein INQ43_10200 [Lysobacter sp. H23M47]
MKNSDSRSLLTAGPLVLVALIVLAALTRVLPHPPNFSPITAIALFGGAYFANRSWALLMPLIGLFVSDLVLAGVNGGLYASWFGGAGIWVVYGCIVLTTVMGFGMRGKVSGGSVLGYSLAGSILFFLVTNFSVFAFDAMYPKTVAGLAAAYVAGIPFFKWSVLGTLFYSAVLFGGFELLRSRVPSLRPQTV